MSALYNEKNLVDVIDQEFPEFINSNFYEAGDKAFEYVHVGNFTSFIEGEFKMHNYEIIKHLLDFLNRVMNEGSKEVQNILQIEIFETMVGHQEFVDQARLQLQGAALRNLEQTLLHFNTVD